MPQGGGKDPETSLAVTGIEDLIWHGVHQSMKQRDSAESQLPSMPRNHKADIAQCEGRKRCIRYVCLGINLGLRGFCNQLILRENFYATGGS
jgi:hypothetical protein